MQSHVQLSTSYLFCNRTIRCLFGGIYYLYAKGTAHIWCGFVFPLKYLLFSLGLCTNHIHIQLDLQNSQGCRGILEASWLTMPLIPSTVPILVKQEIHRDTEHVWTWSRHSSVCCSNRLISYMSWIEIKIQAKGCL